MSDKQYIKKENTSYINLPNSEKYITNSRNEKLHTRHVFTDKRPPKAIIICLHGYGSHINRFVYRKLYENLTQHDYAFIGLDFHGHGYSDGERALVKNYIHLIEDVLCLLIDIFRNGSLTGVGLRKIPFYIMGHSMGGSTAILTSLLLTKSNKFKNECSSSEFYNENKDFIQKNISPHFKGCILISPAVDINISNIPFLKRCISSLPLNVVSNYSIPKFILDENRYNHLSWSCPRYLKYIEDDGYPNNPNGIGYGGNIKLGTLQSIIVLSDTVKNKIKHIEFPFIVMHDSIGDTVLKSSGSKLLINNSCSKDKIYTEIKDGLHDPLANKTDETIKHILKWLNK
jgi:alpha-beta hydrolase superfamily lysophospholipase